MRREEGEERKWKNHEKIEGERGRMRRKEGEKKKRENHERIEGKRKGGRTIKA